MTQPHQHAIPVPERTERNMTPKQSIDWEKEWFPIDDVTYLNFAAHAAIPRVALSAVQLSVAAKMRPHIVDDASFFSVAASLRQTLATLIGASPDEIALTSGAGAGLAAIAYALKWSVGDEVICARGGCPARRQNSRRPTSPQFDAGHGSTPRRHGEGVEESKPCRPLTSA